MATKLEKVKVGEEVKPQGNGHQEPPKRKEVPGGLSDVKSTIQTSANGEGDVKRAKAAVSKVAAAKKVVLPKLEAKQVEDFTFVFNTLAIEDVGSGIASLTLNLVSLKAAQTRLEGANIHPLSSMVLFTKDLKAKVVQVHEALRLGGQ